ncbi:hypothetical protein Tco_0268357 [Tanacetum coccineum]
MPSALSYAVTELGFGYQVIRKLPKVVGWNHTPMFDNGLIEACLLLQVMELGCGSSKLCNDRLISKGIKVGDMYKYEAAELEEIEWKLQEE